MKTLSKIGFILIIIFFCEGCILEDLRKDTKKADDESSPTLALTYDSPLPLLANGSDLVKITVTIKPSVNVLTNRKVSLMTTIGDFFVAGETKKIAEINVDDKGEGFVFLKAPLIASSGVITALSVNSIAKNSLPITFGIALPEIIVVETQNIFLKDSSSNAIKVQLQRIKGTVSEGQIPKFELLDRNTLAINGINASFINISPSNSSGNLTSNLVLEKTPKGKYTIRASIGSVIGFKEIEVIGK